MKKKVIAIFMAAVFVIAGSSYDRHTFAAGSDYDSQITTANQKRAQYEKLRNQLNSDIKDLEKSKGDLQSYINKLDSKMDDIGSKVSDINSKIAKQKVKLAAIEKELNEAKKVEQAQYNTMKRRIKYMYENGSSKYLEMIFSAKDLGEMLSRSEYVQKITDYDSSMLTRFRGTRQKIALRQKQISDAIEQLSGMAAEAKADQDALNTLSERKETQLSGYKSSLKLSQSKKQKYEEEMNKQEQIIESALDEKRKKIEAAAKNPSENNTGLDLYKGKVGKLRWPLKIAGRISSGFGARKAPKAGASTYHKGIDLAVPSGTEIVAAGDGTVVTAMYSASAGNYIMIYHGSSTYTVYMHCSRLAVTEGDKVTRGQVIGYVGSTGNSTGPHLHFGLSINGSYVDPRNYISR